MQQSRDDKEVVLVTGASGFLGQHIVRELQLHDDVTEEIRVLDVVPFVNKLDYMECKPVKVFVADVTDLSACKEAFVGVHTVIHAAALVSYRYPADRKRLEKVNVQGTHNVISLCKEEKVQRLVFISTAEVAMRKRFLLNLYPLIVGQSEVRAKPITNDCAVPFYVYTKMFAEHAVLAADGCSIDKGDGRLRTVSLRPTLLYGELDPLWLPSIKKAAALTCGNLIAPTFGGGRQQFTYVGNAAWAVTAAKEALKEPRLAASLGGEPVFVTDDTSVDHTFVLAESLAGPSLRAPWWATLPATLTWPVAFVAECAAPRLGLTLPIQPSAVISFLGGVICFSRLRASILMNYAPRYTEREALKRTRDFLENQLER